MTNQPEVKYGLPRDVRYCKRCVISNQRPNSTVEFKNKKDNQKDTISFYKDGVCSACVFADMKENEIDWEKREQELRDLCDKYRSQDGSYDCVVPGSGGKDSAFTAHILKYKYNMNPLTVTWAPHIYTDIGWKNMQNWMHVGGFDNVLFTPNGKVHAYLTKLAFQNLGHPFQPFIIGQRAIGPKIAALRNIKLVFYGENQAEYGNNIEDNDVPTMDTKFFTQVSEDRMLLGGVSVHDLVHEHGISRNDLESYMPPKQEELDSVGVQVHYLGYYLKWDPQECYYYAVENTGFQANTERTEGSYSKYSSIDDKIDPFHYYTTLIKFGIGRCTYDAAQEVRNGKITREEGIALVKRFDTEFPSKYFEEFLEYIGITEDEFWETIERFRSPHLWRKVDGKWQLRHPIWEQESD